MRFINLDRFDDNKKAMNEALGFSSKESMFQNMAYACSTFITDKYEFIWDNYSDDEIVALWYLCFEQADISELSLLLVANNISGTCRGAAANGFITIPMLLDVLPKEMFTGFLEIYKELTT